MAVTQGAIGNPDKTFYTISTDDKHFERMGLTSFTIERLRAVIARDNMLTTNSDGLPASVDDVYSAVLGGGILFSDADNAPAILHYDNDLKRYLHKPIGEGAYATAIISAPNDPNSTGFGGTIEALISANNILATGDKTTLDHFLVQLIKDIKVSESGCVSWGLEESLVSSPLFVNTTPGASPSQTCVKMVQPKFRLFLYTTNPNNEREVVVKGPPTFTAMPRTVTGQSYSFADTYRGNYTDPQGNKIETAGYNKFSPPREGGSKNPKNSVAAELAIFYNRNTGQFESGTKQMLARLLTNVPAVEINELPASAAIDLADESDNFDPDGPFYTGWYNEGWALALSVHNGNPNLFGPVWKNKQCKKEEKVKIKCINRSPTDFFKGDIVMLSFIDGEWILQEFRRTAEITPFFGIKKWGFMSYIANSDSFFRDSRYYYEGVVNGANGFFQINPGGGGPSKYGAIITANDYEAHFHKQYFDDFANVPTTWLHGDQDMLGVMTGDSMNNPGLLSAINLGYRNQDEKANGPLISFLGFPLRLAPFQRPDVRFSDRGYYQYTSFDFVGKNLGGLNTHGCLLGRTNRYFGADGGDLGQDPDPSYVFHPFSGPIFAQGYKKSDGTNGSLFGSMNFVQPRGHNGHLFYSTITANNWTNDITSLKYDRNMYGGLFSYVGAAGAAGAGGVNERHPTKGGIGTAKNLPADIALNASPHGNNGLPLDDLASIRGQVSYGQTNGRLPQYMERYFKRWDSTVTYVEQDVLNAGGVVTGTEVNPVTSLGDASTAPDSGIQAYRYSWLGDLGDDYDNENYSSSFYDLKPVAPNSLTFMPLTAEVVASFDVLAGGPAGHAGWDLPYKAGRDFYVRAGNNFRLAHNIVGGGGTPALLGVGAGFTSPGMLPQEFFARTRRVSPLAGATGGSIPWGGSEDMKIATGGSWFPTGWNRDGIPYDWYTVNYAKNHYSPGGAFWWSHTGQNVVADCVGVTTAKCTVGVGAAGAVTFTCNQVIGVKQKATTSGGSTDISIFTWLFTGGALGISSTGPTTQKNPQWGALSDNYYDFGTTALHVRMFEEWPNAQTLFDTRYFAIKHFNEGQRDSGDNNRPRIVHLNQDCTLGPNGVNCKEPTPEKPFDPRRDNYKHSMDMKDYKVDLRVPTYGWVPGTPNNPGGVGQWDGHFIPVGAIMGKNVAVRPQGEWVVNPVRRGVLLPFSYHMRTIGIYEKGDSFVFNHALDGAGNMVPHGGDGYEEGDTFVFYGGEGVVASAKVKVKAIEDNQVNGLAGAIKYPAFDPSTGEGVGLEWVYDENNQQMRGHGYGIDDFADLSVPADKDGGIIRLMGETTNGKDFLCYARAGVVWEKLMTDYAPAEIGGVQRASLPSNNGGGTSNGLSMGTSTVSFPVTAVKKSYDVFMFFHNDIGHTIGHTSDLTFLNSEQQWLTVDINTS